MDDAPSIFDLGLSVLAIVQPFACFDNNKSIVSRNLVRLNSYFGVERHSWYPDIATMMLYNAEGSALANSPWFGFTGHG